MSLNVSKVMIGLCFHKFFPFFQNANTAKEYLNVNWTVWTVITHLYVFVCLFSIWLGGAIRPWVQKVSGGQGYSGSTRPGEDLWAHWRGTYSGHCRTEQLFECWYTADLFDTIKCSLDEEVICVLNNVLSFAVHLGTDLLYKLLIVTGTFTTAHELVSKFTSHHSLYCIC